MKTQIKNKFIALFSVLIIAGSMTSCEKVELVESPLIEITSPVAGSTYKLDDKFSIEANIDAGEITILNYDLTIKYRRGGKDLVFSSWTADPDQSIVDLRSTHTVADSKNKNVIIEVCANLSDNTTSCENMEIKFEK